MAVRKIKRIFLLGHREIEGDLINALQEAGVVEVSGMAPPSGGPESPAPSPEYHEAERKLEQIRYCTGLLNRHSHPSERTARGRVLLTRAEFEEVVRRDDLEEIHRICRELDQRLGGLKTRRMRLEAHRRELLPWHSLETPTLPLPGSRTVVCRAGHLPEARFAVFQEALAARTDLFFVHQVSLDRAARYLLLFHHREVSGTVEELLREHDFAPLPDQPSGRTPGEIIRELDRSLEEAAAAEKRMDEELALLHPRRAALAVLHDHYASLLTREKARLYLARTASSFCLTGWIPESEAGGVRKSLGARFSSLEVLLTEPSITDDVPVLLENNRVVRPFEVVTDLYGRPHDRGVDPTPFLAFFFATFFGFCLTDAGYGLALMAASAWVLWRRNTGQPYLLGKFYIQGEALGRFLRLMFLGGVATVVLGAVVGTWFGVTVSWKLFDALEDLFVFFGLALGLGLLHLLTGLGIKMVRNIRSGDWASGVWDQGLWMAILLGLSGVGLSKAKLLPGSWLPAMSFLSTACALGVVFFQGRGADKTFTRRSPFAVGIYQATWALLALALGLHLLGLARPASGMASLVLAGGILAAASRNLKGVLARVGLGLYSLYGISGFLGDTLSYSRLVALGLSTGIVGMIVNKMSGLLLKAPVYWWPLAAAVLVGGHVFNLLINLLGAFVHSCRLQYVEFFTKFYETGGRPFRAFALEHRNTVIND